MEKNLKKNYLVNVAVSADILPVLNWIGWFPSLYIASPLILDILVLLPDIGFIPFILPSSSTEYNACSCFVVKHQEAFIFQTQIHLLKTMRGIRFSDESINSCVRFYRSSELY